LPKPSDLEDSISAKYDAWNRLVEVKDGIHVVAEFEYDGTGRRVLKAFDSQSPGSPNGIDTYQHIFLAGQQVIETRETASSTAQPETIQPKYQNVWSPRYIDSLIFRDENTDSNWLCDDARVFYLADANYNVTALVATNGDVLERYLYTPYGVVTVLDADFTDDADGVSDYDNTTLYTGREYNPETGIYYYRARYYHAELGRFVGRDPIEDVNLYRYVRSGPTARLDPTGLRDVVEFLAQSFGRIARGEEKTFLELRQCDTPPCGTWGQPSISGEGSYSRSPGRHVNISSTVTITNTREGSWACNAIEEGTHSSKNAGALQIGVRHLDPGIYRVLWMWEYSIRAQHRPNAILDDGGSANVRAEVFAAPDDNNPEGRDILPAVLDNNNPFRGSVWSIFGELCIKPWIDWYELSHPDRGASFVGILGTDPFDSAQVHQAGVESSVVTIQSCYEYKVIANYEPTLNARVARGANSMASGRLAIQSITRIGNLSK